jgi:hypothetical protein
MVIPHYTYLVLKMHGSRGVFSIRRDVKRGFDYDRESCETTGRLTASVELQELKQALAESTPRPGHARGQDIHPTGGHTQQDDSVVRG